MKTNSLPCIGAFFLSCFLFGLCVFQARSEEPKKNPPIIGRWDLTVHTADETYPSWLEVSQSGYKTLAGSFVGRFGSARPISRVEFENGRLRFTVPPQWEQPQKDLVFEGQQVGPDELKGELVDENGHRLAWTGRRAPSLKRDHPPRWGESMEVFNGKDLTGWDGDKSLWKVESGEIVGRTTIGLKHNEFLKSQMVLEDFRLVLKVRLVPNKENSGVQFRSERFGEYEMKGPQADAGAGWWGKLYEENGRALLSDKSGEAWVKVDDWNTYEILAVGSRIRTAINGHLCVDVDDPQIARRGITGLQAHAGGPLEVRFKELHLELNPKFELITTTPPTH